ncbi:MAG: hypothetical protein ACPGVG_17350 [Mycobacterium sp.]
MIRLWDANPTVKLWRRVMAARFAGYARDLGPLPGDTDVFGPRAQSWQKEYQRRTGQATTGTVSDQDLIGLGISPVSDAREMPWLFTVHGTGMADPLGPGLPADTARDVLDKYRWQPIGNYPAQAFPMQGSIDLGYEELVLQIDLNLRGNSADFSMAGYSQGAVVVARVLKYEIQSPAGRLHKYLHRLKKVVFWGNPMRQKDIAHFDHWKYPVAGVGTHGIMADRLEGLESAPFEVRDYAHEGDMYSCITDSDADEWKVMIQRLIFSVTDFFGGEDSLVAQLMEWGERPFSETIAAASAGIDAIRFFTNLDQHNYNRFPAVEFLRTA